MFRWLSEPDSLSFDIDLRVHIFECNIRLLGGLLSAHVLAADSSLGLMGPNEYNDELLALAEDLGRYNSALSSREQASHSTDNFSTHQHSTFNTAPGP